MTGRAIDSHAAKYRTIVADPPWPFFYNGAGWKTNGQTGRRYYQERSGLGYPTMSVDDICSLPVDDLAEKDAHLYLWIPDSLLVEGTAKKVVEAWGFPVGRLLIWEKPSYGLGAFPRSQHEAVMVTRRGSGRPFRICDVGSVIRWKQLYHRGKVNSAKPEGFLDLVEAASHGPYLELFARRNRLGWDTWGNEALEHVEVPA
jgi:N6-adenosine-specific RNA methylase IME4